MPAREQILEALSKVLDPELDLPLTELGMVKAVEVSDGKAHVEIALTVDGCPLKDQIQRDVSAAVRGVDANLKLDLKLSVMSSVELDALKAKLGALKAAKINSQPSPSGPAPTDGRLRGDTGGVNRLPKRVPNLIAVGSGKGGVGKSSVTAQLAVALTREGHTCGILDADITGPSIARIFGVTERPMVKDTDTLIPVPSQAGVPVLSMNLLIRDEKSPVIWRGPLINGAIRQLYANADWSGLDYLLVDMPPGTSDATLTIYQSLPLDGAIIVSTPQALVGMIVSKSLSMAKTLRIPLLGLIENLAYVTLPDSGKPYYLFGAPKGEALANEFGIPYLGAIPIDPAVAEACDKGEIHKVDSPQFRELAKRIVAARATTKA